jgi:hypothetical protein
VAPSQTRARSPLDPIADGTPGDIQFVDGSTVLVAALTGDTIGRTTDGGATWTSHAFGRDVFTGGQHIAVSGNDVWAAGGVDFAVDGAHVAHSTDAGATWSVRALEDAANSYQGGHLGTVAVGSSPTDVWAAGDSRQIFHTVDGMTWAQVANVPPALDQFGGIVVRGSRIVLAATSTDGYSAYESTDGGATFQITGSTRCPFSCGSINGMASPRPGVYFVYGYAGLLWRFERPTS